MAAEQESPDTHYALLVGVNFYCDDINLKGSVRDVQIIKDYLTKSLGRVHIQILTATCNDSDPSRPAENAENLANHKNVIEGLEKITSRAPPGSFIYIHFSAHGTVLAPTSEFSNSSTGDLAVVLLEGDSGSKTRYLRGLELAYQLREMVNKGLRVTLVLDCCAAGSVVRDTLDSSVRYAPYSISVDMSYPPIPGKNLSLEDTALQPAYREGSMGPNWLVNPDGYTILAACGPTEQANEILVDGQHHGALSYFLIRCFQKYGRIGGRQHHIYSHLRARFWDPKFAEQVSKKQTPMFYGNKSLSFFEDACHEFAAVAIPIKQTKGDIQLGAGKAHGVSEGDRFVFHPHSATRQTSTGGEDNVFFEVTQVRELVSFLKISGPQKSIPSGANVIARTRLSLRRFPVRVEIRLPCLSVWTTAVEGRPSLDVTLTEETEPEATASFFYQVVIIAKDYYEIRDHSGQIIPDLPYPPYDLDENANFVLDVVEHLAQFEWLKGLTNHQLMDPAHPFRNMFSVTVIDTLNREFQPGCAQSGYFHPWCSHPECVVEVKHGEKIRLRVENKQGSDGTNLYMHLYEMGSCWEIENLPRTDFIVIPPRAGPKDLIPMREIWSKKIRSKVPQKQIENGRSQCEDIYKIFLTSQPTSFLSLELPELGRATKEHDIKESRGNDFDILSENWAVLSFRIRTSLI